MKSRRDPFTFDALGPDDGTYTVYVRERRLLALTKIGNWKLLEARDLVPQVLRHPTVIFQGVRWEGDEDRDRPGWRCYCAKPPFMFDKHGDQVISDPTQVFLVFVSDDAVAYNWRWELADETDAQIPKGKDRFISKVYDKREQE